VSVLLNAPALAWPEMSIARLPVPAPPESAAKSHSPCPVPARAFSIVAGVVLSLGADPAAGPVQARVPDAALALGAMFETELARDGTVLASLANETGGERLAAEFRIDQDRGP
jgi:hypothetical protein